MKRIIFAFAVIMTVACVTSEYTFGRLKEQIKKAQRDAKVKVQNPPKFVEPRIPHRIYPGSPDSFIHGFDTQNPMKKFKSAFEPPVPGLRFTQKGLTYELIKWKVIDDHQLLTCRLVKGDTISVAEIPSAIVYGFAFFGIREIGPEAFANNNHLIRVIIPDSIKSIGNNAFRGCINLREVSIPKTLSLDSTLFTDCPDVKLIYR